MFYPLPIRDSFGAMKPMSGVENISIVVGQFREVLSILLFAERPRKLRRRTSRRSCFQS